MHLSDTSTPLPPSAPPFYTLVLAVAEVLLCPLYWQVGSATAMVLLGLVQGLIAWGLVRGWRLHPTSHYRLRREDWRPYAGGYWLSLNAGRGAVGLPEARHGDIRLFSDRPLGALIEVRDDER